jgi:hypothetical protein
MKTRRGRIVEVICRQNCHSKCARYLANEIDFDDPRESCPLNWQGRWHSTAPLAESPMPFHPLMADASWEELHVRYLHHDGSDDSEWLLNDFTPRIRSIGCGCMGHWLEMLRRTPPRWDDAFAYFVERHNEVSSRIEREQGLKRPLMTVAGALQRWFKAA